MIVLRFLRYEILTILLSHLSQNHYPKSNEFLIKRKPDLWGQAFFKLVYGQVTVRNLTKTLVQCKGGMN